MFPGTLVLAVVAASIAVAPALAHHSTAMFDQSKVVSRTGTIKQLEWVNPHVKIHIRDGAGETWEVEAGPLNLLSRMGIERDMIEVGETIRVRGNPGRRDAHSLWVSNILLPDNTELLAAPGPDPAAAADLTAYAWDGKALAAGASFEAFTSMHGANVCGSFSGY